MTSTEVKNSKKKVFFFGSDPGLMDVVSGIVAGLGYSFEVVTDREAGLGGVMDHAPDMIMIELERSGTSGFDILDGVRAENRRLPVILFGDSSAENILRALRGGATDYFVKPVRGDVLNERLAAILPDMRREADEMEEEKIRRLLENMERNNRELTTLLEITSSFSVSGNSKKELLNRLTELAAEFMNCEAASIMLVNERTDSLEFVVATGEKKNRLETISVPMGEGIAGWVAVHGKPEVVNDTSKDPRFTGSVDRESGFVTRQILAVPLRLENRIIGVLEVINTKDGRRLGNDDLRLLANIGERAATVIETVKVIEEQQNFYVQTTNIIVKAIEKKDVYSVGHSWSVAELCHKIAADMNLSETEKSDLHFGALLHDIGKLDMPSSLFNKRSLSEREIELIRRHPVNGAKLLEPIMVWKGVVPHVLYHHEAWDGSGYPFGHTGESIPLGARIINLAEAYTVMRSPNSYKKRMSIKEAILEVMRMSGKQFDPDIVKVLISVLERSRSI